MPDLDFDEKPKRLRIRLDVYDQARQQYRPLSGLSAIIPVESTRMHRPLWRELKKWLKTAEWEDTATAEDRT